MGGGALPRPYAVAGSARVARDESKADDAAPPRRARLGGVGTGAPGASFDPFAVHMIDGGAHRGRDTPGSVTRCAIGTDGAGGNKSRAVSDQSSARLPR